MCCKACKYWARKDIIKTNGKYITYGVCHYKHSFISAKQECEHYEPYSNLLSKNSKPTERMEWLVNFWKEHECIDY